MKLEFKNGQIIVIDTSPEETPNLHNFSLSFTRQNKYKNYERPELRVFTSAPIHISKKAFLLQPEIISDGAKCVADLGFRHYVSYGKDALKAVTKAWENMKRLGYKVRLPEGFEFDVPYPNNTTIIISTQK